MSSKVKKNNYIAWIVITILILVLVSQQGAFTYKDRSIEAAGADVTITLGDYKKTLQEFQKQLEETLTQIDVAIAKLLIEAGNDSTKREAITTKVIPAFKVLKKAVEKELALVKELLAKLTVNNFDEEYAMEQTGKIAAQISIITSRITTLIYQVASSSFTVKVFGVPTATFGVLDLKNPNDIPKLRERFGTIATKEEIKNYQGWWVYVIGDKSYYLLDSKGNKISVARNIFAQAVYYKKDGELISFTIYDKLLEQTTNLEKLKNKLDEIADETTPIIFSDLHITKPVTKDQLNRIKELREENRILRERLKQQGNNPKSSFNLINFLAQAPRMKVLPDKSKPPTTNKEADILIKQLEAEQAQLIKEIKEKLSRPTKPGAKIIGITPITDPPVISDGEIKISECKVDIKTGICTLIVQICYKNTCYAPETITGVSLDDLNNYYDKENPNKDPLEEYILDKIDSKFKDFVLQPPFDDLEQKLADKIKERDAEIANKIKLYSDLIAHIKGNWQEIYPDTLDGAKEANDQVEFLEKLLERLEKERLEGSKKK